MKMRCSVLLTILVTALTATAAGAVTITNKDGEQRRIVVLGTGDKLERAIKPGETIKDLCPRGCVVRIDDRPEWTFRLERGIVVAIEGGEVYYEDATPPVPDVGPPPKKGR